MYVFVIVLCVFVKRRWLFILYVDMYCICRIVLLLKYKKSFKLKNKNFDLKFIIDFDSRLDVNQNKVTNTLLKVIVRFKNVYKSNTWQYQNFIVPEKVPIPISNSKWLTVLMWCFCCSFYVHWFCLGVCTFSSSRQYLIKLT